MGRRSRGGTAGLRRPVGQRQPKKRVVVICEGSKTEPEYLRHLNKRARDALVELQIVDDDHTQPKLLVAHAADLLRESTRAARRTRDPNEKIDEIWCAFDVDEHPHLHEARQQANDAGVRLAVSNPSIEVWFLLHFQDQTAHIHRSDALYRLRSHIGGYDKRLPTLDPLLDRFEAAKQRALHLERKHEGDETAYPEDNPGSGMHRLVETLQAAY